MKPMSKAQRREYLERALASIAPNDDGEVPSPRQGRDYISEEFDISIPIGVIRDLQMGAITEEELELGDDGTIHEVQPAR